MIGNIIKCKLNNKEYKLKPFKSTSLNYSPC